jgi:hypothetical protein
MNSTSLTFALGVAGAIAATSWFIDWGARRAPAWTNSKRRLVTVGLYLFAIVAGVWVYQTDATMRGTTLFEVSGPWEEIGDRNWTVVVEHPGVEHALMIYPNVPPGESSTRPVVLNCQFGEEGNPPLVEEESVHEVVSKSGKYATGTTWSSAEYRFTPDRSGPYLLIVTAPDGYPPKIHLRLTDPEKRDGKRAPGY